MTSNKTTPRSASKRHVTFPDEKEDTEQILKDLRENSRAEGLAYMRRLREENEKKTKPKTTENVTEYVNSEVKRAVEEVKELIERQVSKAFKEIRKKHNEKEESFTSMSDKLSSVINDITESINDLYKKIEELRGPDPESRKRRRSSMSSTIEGCNNCTSGFCIEHYDTQSTEEKLGLACRIVS